MRHPLATKAALVAALVVLLMIPVGMIRGLVAERQARSQEAIAGIAEGWGKRQTVTSPYLAVPYERQWTAVKRETIDGKLRETRTEHRELQVLRLPASNVQWTVDTTLAEKARGVYKARLYSAHIAASGTIEVPARGERGRHEPLPLVQPEARRRHLRSAGHPRRPGSDPRLEKLCVPARAG